MMINVYVTALLLVVVFSFPTIEALVPPKERDALVALFKSTNGPLWTQKANWLDGNSTHKRSM
eukprot:m.3894 g.3894  ORF g.3894 m.3894 type:complete len:63 (-) comp2846_c0_seq1:490-678(-)